MKPVVLLTTYNRPELLEQSLPQIERESLSVGADLYIHDDQSDNEDTLVLLAEAASRGVNVIRREYSRNSTNLNNHELTGLANIFAFKYILADRPDWTHLVKVDDDTYWYEGGLSMMIEQYEKARSDGVNILWFSGISTTNEPEIEDHSTYSITDGCCNAAVMYSREDLEDYVDKIPLPYIINEGFDTCYLWRWGAKYKPGAVSVTIKPSVVYHTGMTGVHVQGTDLNRNFIGDVSAIKSA